MLDVHALYLTGGNVALTQILTIPSNDGAVVAGVPLLATPGKATLTAWGGAGVAVADAIKQIALYSNDLNDPANASIWTPTGTSLAINTPHFLESLPFKSAARVIKAAQKAAADEFVFLIDNYNPADVHASCIFGGRCPPNRGIYSQTMGALTAKVWGSTPFVPTNNLPGGSYAILGFWTTALTNVALIRFQHADFGMVQPGCMAADFFGGALTLANYSADDILLDPGYQFVRFGEITGAPQCPVFRAGPTGTGLQIWGFDLTADTPTVILNLVYLG